MHASLLAKSKRLQGMNETEVHFVSRPERDDARPHRSSDEDQVSDKIQHFVSNRFVRKAKASLRLYASRIISENSRVLKGSPTGKSAPKERFNLGSQRERPRSGKFPFERLRGRSDRKRLCPDIRNRRILNDVIDPEVIRRKRSDTPFPFLIRQGDRDGRDKRFRISAASLDSGVPHQPDPSRGTSVKSGNFQNDSITVPGPLRINGHIRGVGVPNMYRQGIQRQTSDGGQQVLRRFQPDASRKKQVRPPRCSRRDRVFYSIFSPPEDEMYPRGIAIRGKTHERIRSRVESPSFAPNLAGDGPATGHGSALISPQPSPRNARPSLLPTFCPRANRPGRRRIRLQLLFPAV